MKTPRLGVGVMVLKEDKVLLGKRHDDPEKARSELSGEGSWTMPGGKVDFKETVENAAKRELFEETGIKAAKDDLKFFSVTDEIKEDVHFVTIGFIIRNFENNPEVKEPEEITEWKWFELNNLPNPIYPPSAKILDKYKNGNKFSNGK